jgi:adenosylhomocysteine nucleosidase
MPDAVDVVVVCALTEESRAAQSVQTGPFEGVVCGGARAVLGTLGAARCLTLASGLGDARLDLCFQAVAERYRPRLLINFGSAGAIRGDLPVGAPTIPREVVSYSWPDLAPNGEAIPIPHAESLANLDSRLEITRAGTCPRSIEDEGVRDRLFRELRIDTTDWETYRLAAHCRERGIPFAALRCISDYAGAAAREEYQRNADSVLDLCAPLLVPLAESLLREAGPRRRAAFDP